MKISYHSTVLLKLRFTQYLLVKYWMKIKKSDSFLNKQTATRWVAAIVSFQWKG